MSKSTNESNDRGRLVLRLAPGERAIINPGPGQIVITASRKGRKSVLWFDAPKADLIVRGELLDREAA